MDIILKQDVDTLGSKYDVVTVKDGFARNYLIPQGLAVVATKSNMKVNDEVIRQQAHKAAKAKEAAQAIAEKLGGLSSKAWKPVKVALPSAWKRTCAASPPCHHGSISAHVGPADALKRKDHANERSSFSESHVRVESCSVSRSTSLCGGPSRGELRPR